VAVPASPPKGRKFACGASPAGGVLHCAVVSGGSTRHRLDEVYGVARDLPINYVTRQGVDGEFVASLTRDKHIVVFGSSKQGNEPPQAQPQ
jgi:hypothetical protein